MTLMKRLICTLVFLALAVGAYAQYIPDGTLKRHGCGMRMDRQKLTKEQQAIILQDIDGVDYTKQWKTARNWRAAGIAMTAGGAGVAVVGVGMGFVYIFAEVLGIALAAPIASIGGEDGAQEAADNINDQMSPYIAASFAAAGLGAVTSVAGIPIIVVNCKKMNKIVKAYNGRQKDVAVLSWGPTHSGGTGLSLNF